MDIIKKSNALGGDYSVKQIKLLSCTGCINIHLKKFFFIKVFILRGIKNIKDTVGKTNKEDTLQQSISLMYGERSRARASRNGQLSKMTLRNIISN